MAERYWITGVELALLMNKHIPNTEKTKIGNEVIDKQFIGNYPTDEDKKRFEVQIKKIK